MSDNRKTIAQHMKDILVENGRISVTWGDLDVLDLCATRADHTNLSKVHPLLRHKRILDALDRSSLLDKSFIQLDVWHNAHRNGYRAGLVRRFELTDNRILIRRK